MMPQVKVSAVAPFVSTIDQRWTRRLSQKHFRITASLLVFVTILTLLTCALVVLLLLRPANANGNGVREDKPYELPVNNTDVNNDVDAESGSPKVTNAPTDISTNLTAPERLKLVSRLEWMAQPPVSAPDPLPAPVPYVIIHQTATENCFSRAQCVFHVRFIQTFHIESRNWWDIAYNFLVGGDGEAYEGRGWTSQGAHSYGYNSKSIGIAFIGTFNLINPPQRQITACKQLIDVGVEKGYIKKDYKLLGARQLQTTQSPGIVLYGEMKTWDHWAKAP